MGKSKETKKKSPKSRPPAKTPEAREKQLIAKVYDLVEEDIDNGTASEQVKAHFLKLATTKAKLENDLAKEEIKLKKAKTDQIESTKKMEALYEEALVAFSSYRGLGQERDEEEDYYYED